MKGHTVIRTTELQIGDFVTLEIDKDANTSTTVMGEVVAIRESAFNPDGRDLKIRHIDAWIYDDATLAVVGRVGAPE